MNLADELDAYTSRVQTVVAEHGFMVQYVLPDEDGTGAFAYTVGFTAKGQPELLICGLSSDLCHELAWRAWDLIKDLTPNDDAVLLAGTVLDDWVGNGYSLIVCETTSDSAFVTRRLYTKPVFHQLVYPDALHRWPWEAGYTLPASAQGSSYVIPEGCL